MPKTNTTTGKEQRFENVRTILHETANLYLNGRLEICLNGITHAVVIGKAKSIEQAKRVMANLERHPKSLTRLHN